MLCFRTAMICIFLLLGTFIFTVEAQQAQCRSYMGGESSSFLGGGIHRYTCCEDESSTIHGGGSTIDYCNPDGSGTPKTEYSHTLRDSFECRDVGSCRADANEDSFLGLSTADTPLLCWSYTGAFERCCQNNRRRQTSTANDDSMYDDQICPKTNGELVYL